MVGIDKIAAERARQVAKGFTSEHDDQHENGKLVDAAFVYAYSAEAWNVSVWPWEPERLEKIRAMPRIRALTIAGALIAAEIDRLERADADRVRVAGHVSPWT